MGKPDDIPQWAWDKAREGIPPVYFKMEGMSPTLHVLRVGIAKAILSAVEEEREECATLVEGLGVPRVIAKDRIMMLPPDLATAIRNRKGA